MIGKMKVTVSNKYINGGSTSQYAAKITGEGAFVGNSLTSSAGNPLFHENMADLVDEETATKSFEDLGVNDWMINQCKALGLTRPTPIQYHCVPEILKGKAPFKYENLKS